MFPAAKAGFAATLRHTGFSENDSTLGPGTDFLSAKQSTKVSREFAMTAINQVTDFSKEGEIGVITLNSPPVNALSAAVRDGLHDGFKAAIADPAVKAIVLICEGRTFIAGADISEFGGAQKGAEPVRRAGDDGEIRQSRSSPRSTAPRLVAASRLRSARTTASQCRAHGAVCRKSTSASCPAQAARSACRASPASRRRWR